MWSGTEHGSSPKQIYKVIIVIKFECWCSLFSMRVALGLGTVLGCSICSQIRRRRIVGDGGASRLGLDLGETECEIKSGMRTRTITLLQFYVLAWQGVELSRPNSISGNRNRRIHRLATRLDWRVLCTTVAHSHTQENTHSRGIPMSCGRDAGCGWLGDALRLV